MLQNISISDLNRVVKRVSAEPATSPGPVELTRCREWSDDVGRRGESFGGNSFTEGIPLHGLMVQG